MFLFDDRFEGADLHDHYIFLYIFLIFRSSSFSLKKWKNLIGTLLGDMLLFLFFLGDTEI